MSGCTGKRASYAAWEMSVALLAWVTEVDCQEIKGIWRIVRAGPASSAGRATQKKNGFGG